MSAVETRRAEALTELKRRYEALGYDVQLDAPIPGSDKKADALAKKSGDTVLLEVRVASSADERGSLVPVSELAAAAGWRFVIALADARGVQEVEGWTPKDIEARFVEAASLPSVSTAKSMLAWSILEAAGRVALGATGTVVGASPPRAILQQLATRGLISLDEERQLGAALEFRNRAAHGLKLPEAANFELVLSVARRLLSDRVSVPA